MRIKDQATEHLQQAAASTTFSERRAIEPGLPEPERADDAVQLSHLSSVLNSLQTNASTSVKKTGELGSLVKSNQYSVSPKAVSHAIVNEMLDFH